MCPSKPKTPKVQDIPIRAMGMLPDNGDPSVRMGIRARRALTTSASILANRNGQLNLPTVTTPTGTTGM